MPDYTPAQVQVLERFSHDKWMDARFVKATVHQMTDLFAIGALEMQDVYDDQWRLVTRIIRRTEEPGDAAKNHG